MKSINLKNLKILLIEDIPEEADKILSMLDKLEIKDIEYAQTYRKAVKLFDKFSFSFDLIISDVFLGKHHRRGDDFVDYIRNMRYNIPVIYLTSFYDSKTYEEVKRTLPKCFLNKELSLLSLRQAIELSLMQEEKTSSAYQVDTDTIFIKVGNKVKPLKISEIFYLYVHSKTTYIQTKERNYPIHVTLNWRD